MVRYHHLNKLNNVMKVSNLLKSTRSISDNASEREGAVRGIPGRIHLQEQSFHVSNWKWSENAGGGSKCSHCIFPGAIIPAVN